MDPATTRAIMIMRRGLSSDDRASLGKLGDRLQPSGQFAVPEGSQGAALAWREFFIEVINPWCDARRAVAAALLAPEINTGREELLALEWEPNIKPPVLNTLLARLAQVSSGAIGNALRAVRWEKKLFKGILVGERDSLPAIPAKTEVERELDVHKLLLPGEGTAEDRIKKLHVVVVSSEPGAAGKFLHPPSPTCPSPQDLAQVIAPGGYVVWVRELSAQVVEISHSLAAFRSKFSEFMRLGLRLGPHQDERRAEFRNGLRDLIGKYTPIIEPAWFYELRHSNMALKSRKKAGAVEFVFKPAGESIL
ncbi:MAG TPA: hypothetical protein VN673_14595, partial [Clostridia bacterium]|nr:hypothetical protein [Clostridia bacterium]